MRAFGSLQTVLHCSRRQSGGQFHCLNRISVLHTGGVALYLVGGHWVSLRCDMSHGVGFDNLTSPLELLKNSSK
jgi:hypothetical protein